jgi:hypothetical protein
MSKYRMDEQYDEYKQQIDIVSEGVSQVYPGAIARIHAIFNIQNSTSSIDIHYLIITRSHMDNVPLSQPRGYEVYEKDFGIINDVDAYFSTNADDLVSDHDCEFFNEKISILVPLELNQIDYYINNKINFEAMAFIDTPKQEYKELKVDIPYEMLADFIPVFNKYAQEGDYWNNPQY